MARAKVKAGGILRKSLDNGWRTPRLIREAVRAYFSPCPFLDVATAPDNPMGAARFFCGPNPDRVPHPGPMFSEPGEVEANRVDGLAEPWNLPWWCNPPYGTELRAWIEKVCHEVDLVPEQEGLLLLAVNRTEETWIHDLWDRASRVLLIRYPTSARGRVPFESSVDGAEDRADYLRRLERAIRDRYRLPVSPWSGGEWDEEMR